MTGNRGESEDSPTTYRSEAGVAAPPGYRLRLALARAVLFWEGLWPALWPAAGLLGVFLAVALLGLLPALPGWLHLLALVAFAGSLAYALWSGLRGLRAPSVAAARRRLEHDNNLPHRPLAALEDRLAEGEPDPAAAALWEAHRQRLLERARRLRLSPPRASWASVDSFALRAVVGLLLLIAAVGVGDRWSENLGRVFTPSFATALPETPPSLDIWVNPPAYTGLPPRFLDPVQDGGEIVDVPQGSVLLAQVQGGRGEPVLRLDETAASFDSVAEGVWRKELTLDEGRNVSIEQDKLPVASFGLNVIPDRIPVIEYLMPPGQAARGALELSYLAGDDYGLADIKAVIRRSDDAEADPLELELVLPGPGLTELEDVSYHDLTPHPWAGIGVTITLEATDGRGQVGRTEAFETVMPERIFNHPVARALAEVRKHLTLNPEDTRRAAAVLNKIGEEPAHFFYDVVVSLALVSAERRLLYDRRPESVGEVQQLLWDTALRIEDGELALAERDLREIQRQLQEALARGAPDSEIEDLLDQLQEALDRFLSALQEQMAEQMENGQAPEMEFSPDTEMLTGQDLQQMIEQAREMARSGARDQAQEMLSQLQQMLENLQTGQAMQGMNEQAREAQEMMREMEDLMQQQQELLDRSFQRSREQGQSGQRQQQGENGGQREPGQSQAGREGQLPSEGQPGERGEGSANQGDATRQEELRRQLGEMMRRLGEATGDIPRPLGNAERSMRDAREALGREAPGEAVGPQGDALDQLQQGLQTMLEDFMQQMGQGRGQQGQQSGMTPGEGRDPLGRGSGEHGQQSIDNVEIPGEMDLRRSREILQELRRRSGQRSRPQFELDYIDRLLQQF